MSTQILNTTLILSCIAGVAVLIWVLLGIRKLVDDAGIFIRNIDDRIKPLLDEAGNAVRNINRISDDVGTVTSSARDLSDAVSVIVKNVVAANNLVEDIKSAIPVRAAGLRAGAKAALAVLISQIRNRRQ
ncbi:MAG: DUF948 domain-containing protein [Dissulfurispiraceae bacterium]|nr:DUF948 domain-containing protein [Dissulfurispiraceae bacterium]